MHNIKESVTYEVKFAIGSKEGYHGPSFTKEDVVRAIGEFQETSPVAMPVKITDHVTFVIKDYVEDGWDISAICYPNSINTPKQVKEFMFGLAEHLLYHFKQNRITIRTFPYWDSDDMPLVEMAFLDFPSTIMFEIPNAEKNHTR